MENAQPAVRTGRGRGRVDAIASLGVLLVALTLVGCAAGGLPTTASSSTAADPSATATPTTDAPDSPDPTPAQETGVEMSIDDLPQYDAAENYVVGMWERYSDPASPHYAPGLLPQTEGGTHYARDFLLILADLRSVFRFLPGTSSDDVAALETQLQSYVDKATEAERKFLAGEDFGMSFRITEADGTEYVSDGVNRSNE
jgi:hypothetical protein